ncbi:MAG TPA: amino acid permease, partial [Verrucomicrobiae bacterium]|nr:amino acid permease [Verrucomicrobiae bacterium]
LFTGARLYYALGVQERAFAWLGQWNERRGTPLRALVLQTLVALVLIGVFGWSGNGFEHLVIFTTPVFWSFLLLVALAVIILRFKDPQTPRPFRLPLFPLEALLFVVASGAMIYASIAYMLGPVEYLPGGKRDFAYWFSAGAMLVPALVGVVVFALTRQTSASARNLDD